MAVVSKLPALAFIFLSPVTRQELPPNQRPAYNNLHYVRCSIGHLKTDGVPQALFNGMFLAVTDMSVNKQGIMNGIDRHHGAEPFTHRRFFVMLKALICEPEG